MRPLEEYEKLIGYRFRDRKLLETALTHSSYANEHKCKSYERLEFLGDSVLGFVAAEYLFHHFPELPEGQLTKNRAALVCEKSLCGFSKSLQAGDFLRLSHGELHSGGKERPSILADVFESTTAAIYLDSGDLEQAKKFILTFLAPAAKAQNVKPFKDYKTTLQEIIQQNPEEKLIYKLVGEKGPDHDKRFFVEVDLNGTPVGSGKGHSKKEAEQMAAKAAIAKLGG